MGPPPIALRQRNIPCHHDGIPVRAHWTVWVGGLLVLVIQTLRVRIDTHCRHPHEFHLLVFDMQTLRSRHQHFRIRRVAVDPAPLALTAGSGLVEIVRSLFASQGVALLAGDPPAHKRRVRGQTGADHADEGLDAGPDKDLAHGPGKILGFDQLFNHDDPHDTGHADAVRYTKPKVCQLTWINTQKWRDLGVSLQRTEQENAIHCDFLLSRHA